MVRPIINAVDHLNLIRHHFAIVQRIEEQFPQTHDRPTAKLTIDARPFAKIFREIAPLRTGTRNPEYTIQNLTVIVRKPAATPTNSDDEWFEKRPFCVLHQLSRQDCLLQKATLMIQNSHLFWNPVCQQNLGQYIDEYRAP